MMKKIFSHASIVAVTMLGLACSGNIDPDDTGEQDGLEDEIDSTVVLSSNYSKKMIAMQFTSVGCTYCPILTEALRQVEENHPGAVIPVAFHMDFGGMADPMTLPMNTKFYEKVTTGEGLPMFALDFEKSSQHIVNEYAKIVSEMELQVKEHPARCGVAIETVYEVSTRSVEVKARFRSDVAREYRYHIFLLEDGIEASQAGSDEVEYVHDNVLRMVASDDLRGARLNSGEALEPVTEYEVTKTLKLDQAWNPENMKVVVAMLDTEDGSTFCCNNANVCDLGKSTDYSIIGEEKPVKTRFQRHVCVMEFTGTWCAQCPAGATVLNYLVSRSFAGKAFALAFHNDDEYSIPQEQELYKMFKWGGYPAFVTDMCEDKVGLLNDGGCGSSIESRLYDSETHCGAAVSCTYDAEKKSVDVDARMISEKGMTYRMAVYVVEDKVIGKQTQSTGDVQKDYTHRHMVRKMLSSSVLGDSLGEVPAGDEVSKVYSFPVADGWNLKNLSVAVLILDKDGHVNNVATCQADGGKMDYVYLK